MVDVLFKPVFCDDDEEDDCDSKFDDKADDMEEDSYKLSFGWAALIVQTVIGFTMMYYGLGVASNRLGKRLRDNAFQSLIRQEVGFFDTLNVSSLTSQLQDDANSVQAFTSQPVRVIVMNVFSVLLGTIISFILMWPLALGIALTIPVFSIGIIAETAFWYGADDKDSTDVSIDSPGGIIIESLTSIRTVASLTLEEYVLYKYNNALTNESKTYVTNCYKLGAITGFGSAIQMCCFGFYIWLGGSIMDAYPSYDFDQFAMCMMCLILSLTGMAVAMTDAISVEDATGAAERLFKIINRKSKIDPFGEGIEGGKKSMENNSQTAATTLETPLLSSGYFSD